MGENTRRAYDLAAPTYDAEPNSVLFTEDATVLGMLALRPGDRLLDAACGTGKYLVAASRLGAACAGTDFATEMLARAAAKCPAAALARHDLERPPLPFPDGAFTAAVFAHGLRHVMDLAPVFADFARVLAPGGRLAVSVTHPEAPFKLFKYLAKDLGDYDEPDLAGEKAAHSAQAVAAAAISAGLRPAGEAVIPVDARLEPLLTPDSYRATAGRPLILALKFVKPAEGPGEGVS